jgi:hypothetical protein
MNDFSESPKHFLAPDFRLFSEKPSFSTATPLITNNLRMRLAVITPGNTIEPQAASSQPLQLSRYGQLSFGV